MALGINNALTGVGQNRYLQNAQKSKSSAMEKLSSGLKINKGSDDPSGLLISELLRSQLSGMNRALRNTQESNNVMSIAEGGLSSVSSMLNKMRGLAVHALNSGVTSGSQISADQMEMNSALSSINRVVTTTSYGDNKLLDGSRDFSFETSDTSGMLNAAGTAIYNVSGSVPSEIAIEYAGGDTAVQAEKAVLEADFGGATTQTAQEFTVTGSDGARTYSFAEGASVADMAEIINQSAESTGVNAYAVRDEGSGATTLRLVSSDYGSAESVKVSQIAGDAFAAAGQTVMDSGQDATVSINGEQVTTQGLTASVSGGGVNMKVSFAEGEADATTIAQTGYDQDQLVDATDARTSAITNISGGMTLQLGEGSGSQNRENVALGNYGIGSLGTVVQDGERYSINDLFGGGAASLQNDPELALKIIDQAISDVSSGRASIGAYQSNTLDTNASNLMAAMENTTATESGIRDADMAEMMTLFIKNQLLENAGIKSIQSGMMNAQNVLGLLHGS